MGKSKQMSVPSGWWVVARWVAVMVTVGLIGALWIAPSESLSVFWYVLIPLLPATFLINVELWRNVCPLATLNTLTGSWVGSRTLSRDVTRRAGIVAIALLAVMVPARHFLFNVDASVLGATVIVTCLLAIVGGLLFDMKAGFCNSICPVLPVERLYGQRPLISLRNARCTPCTRCSKPCLDLMPTKSAQVLADHGGRQRAWTLTAYGAFAAAFPGFVIAYYLLVDTTLAEAGIVYGVTAVWSVVSWLIVTAAFRMGGVSRATGLIWCAGIAVGLYYWHVAPGIAKEFGLSGGFIWGTRIVMLGLVATWLAQGLRPGRAASGGAVYRA